MPGSIPSLAGDLLSVASNATSAERDVDPGAATLMEAVERRCAICHWFGNVGAGGEIGPEHDTTDGPGVGRFGAVMTGSVGIVQAFDEVPLTDEIETSPPRVVAPAGKDGPFTRQPISPGSPTGCHRLAGRPRSVEPPAAVNRSVPP